MRSSVCLDIAYHELGVRSNAGTLRFMVLNTAIDAPTLIRFFRRL